MEQISIDELRKQIENRGYADAASRAQIAAPYVCGGDLARLAAVLRHGLSLVPANTLVMLENVRDAAAIIEWHKDGQPTQWEKDEAAELEQVWRIFTGYDEETTQVAPPRQRGSVAKAARDLLRQSALKEGLKEDVKSMVEAMNCAPVELAAEVQKLAGERESVRSVFGVPADASLFEAASKLKARSAAVEKAIAGRNIHIDDLPGLILLLCRCIGSNDREVILARLTLAGNMVNELGGWDHAYENLRKLDKAAEDLVNRNTNFDQMIEDRDAWRRIALKLAE